MRNLKTQGRKEPKKIPLNRGVELLLRKKKLQKNNVILFQFGKLLNLFKREITVYFEFSLDIRKPKQKEN
ncbi:hypothetical protein [Synechococcus phage DSL-LC02]|nr:hypothetical protein [Synechococcus phage DSL-LC02]